MRLTKLVPLVAALAACSPAADQDTTPEGRAARAALSPEDGCVTCHVTGGGPAGADVDDHVFGNGIVATIDGGEWAAYGHGATSPYEQSGNPGALLAAPLGCLYCHAGAPLYAGGEASAHGEPSNPFRLANAGGASGKVGVCLVCHGVASTGFDPDSAGTELELVNATVKVGATHFGPRHGAVADGGQYCWDCHDPHGDYNYTASRAIAFMIQARPVQDHVGASGWGVPTALAPAVDFNVAGGSSPTAFDAGDYAGPGLTGICQVCHTATAYYRRDLYTPTHNATADCTLCHPHDQPPSSAFVAAAPAFDTTPPTAAITGPTEGAYVRGTVPVVASVWDDLSGVVRAELWLEAVAPIPPPSTVVPVSGTATFALDTAALPDGVALLVVNAHDGAGNVGTSARVAVTVDNTPPAVAIASPASGATLKGTVTISATASDAMGVAKVDFYVDGRLHGTDAAAPFSVAWSTKGAAGGTHALTAVATDRAGNATASAVVSVRTR